MNENHTHGVFVASRRHFNGNAVMPKPNLINEWIYVEFSLFTGLK